MTDAKAFMLHQLEPYLVEVMRERLTQRLGPELHDMIPAIVQESEQRFQRASANTTQEPVDHFNGREDEVPVPVLRE
jgi:hypothetical protein